MSDWISAKDRVPLFGDDPWGKDIYLGIGHRIGPWVMSGEYIRGDCGQHVTHWMHILAPPKETRPDCLHHRWPLEQCACRTDGHGRLERCEYGAAGCEYQPGKSETRPSCRHYMKYRWDSYTTLCALKEPNACKYGAEWCHYEEPREPETRPECKHYFHGCVPFGPDVGRCDVPTGWTDCEYGTEWCEYEPREEAHELTTIERDIFDALRCLRHRLDKLEGN